MGRLQGADPQRMGGHEELGRPVGRRDHRGSLSEGVCRLSFLGSSRHRRHGLRGARDAAGGARRDGRGRARDARLPRVALGVTSMKELRFLPSSGAPRHPFDSPSLRPESLRAGFLPEGEGLAPSGRLPLGEGRGEGHLALNFRSLGVAVAVALLLAACDGRKRVTRATVVPPQPEVNYTSFDSPSLQFLPRQQEAPGWQLEEDPIVVPGNRLISYLDRDGVHFERYEAIDLTVGKYRSTQSPAGFATVEIFRFPDFVKAFGAYSTRKIGQVQFLDVANESFMSRHSVHLWRGPFYVRIVGGGTPDGNDSLRRLLAFVAERMPAAPAKPAVFNFFPVANRIPNSERYSAEDGFGQSFLANSFQATFNVENVPVDGLIVPAADK